MSSPNLFGICPYLGLENDPASCACYARDDHVCALPGVAPPTIQWQQQYCLTSKYAGCRHFRHRPKVVSITPVRQHGLIARLRAGSVTTAGAVAVLAMGVVVTAATAGMSPPTTPTAAKDDSRLGAVVDHGSPTASPRGSATASPGPTLTPTSVAPADQASVSPTPSVPTATPTPTPSPTPEPTPTSPPPPPPTEEPPLRTHTVGSGETLWDIAQLYNTTVDALVELNGIEDRNFIRPGTVVEIPSADE